MNSTNRYLLRALLVSLLLVAVVYAQKKPEIGVSPVRVKAGDPVILTGTGFTPNRSVMSHLRRPDASEYNPLRLRTDERGEFSHKIDTVMMDAGSFELWVEDEASKVTDEGLNAESRRGEIVCCGQIADVNFGERFLK